MDWVSVRDRKTRASMNRRGSFWRAYFDIENVWGRFTKRRVQRQESKLCVKTRGGGVVLCIHTVCVLEEEQAKVAFDHNHKHTYTHNLISKPNSDIKPHLANFRHDWGFANTRASES